MHGNCESGSIDRQYGTNGFTHVHTYLGATARAFLIRFCLRRIFLAGWLNQVFTYRCQSLWKWPFGIILFPLPMIDA